eukprot:scaffold94463_cov37-Phaeocystis_antarctica.AAC.1
MPVQIRALWRRLGGRGTTLEGRGGCATDVQRACGALAGWVRRGRGQAGGGRRLGVRAGARRRGLRGVGALVSAWRQGDHQRARLGRRQRVACVRTCHVRGGRGWGA